VEEILDERGLRACELFMCCEVLHEDGQVSIPMWLDGCKT